MPGSSISKILDELESSQVRAGDGLRKLNELPWGVAEADRVVRISRQALERTELEADGRGIALLLLAKGCRFQANYKEAGSLLRRARREYRSVGDLTGVATCDLVSGVIRAETGRPAAALRSYRRACKSYERLGDLKGVASSTFNSGLIHFQQTQPAEALDCYTASEEVYRELGQATLAATCRMNIGNIHLAAGRYEEALKVYVEARNAFDEQGDRNRSATCRMNAGNAFAGAGRHRQAVAMFEEAREALRSIGNQRLVAACLLNAATSEVELKRHAEAAELLRSALDTFRRIEDYYGTGECHLLLSKILKSADEATAAKECFGRTGDKLMMAAALMELAKRGSAEERLTEALEALEGALSARNASELRPVVRQRFGGLGPALVSEALNRGDISKAIRFSERSGFTKAEALEQAIRFESDEEHLQTLLAFETPSFISAPVQRDRLSSLAAKVSERLSQPGDEVESERSELYRLLVEPIVGRLHPGETLYLSPGHVLRRLPFPCLLDGAGRCLIERHPVVSGVRRADVDLPRNGLLLSRSGFGAPLPGLPGATEEIRAIRNLGADAQSMHQEEAKVGQALRLIAAADWVHIATHAVENKLNPLASALVLEPDQDHPSGNLYAREIAALRIDARLVVLSACETATGSQSLAQAFLDAGARCVLAGAWRANDQASGIWMRTFYEKYLETGNAAIAHQQACIRALRSEHNSAHLWALWTLQS